MNKYIKIALALAAAYIFFKYLFSYVAPFIIGFIIALLLEPLVKILIKRGNFKRSLASVVALLIFMLIGLCIGVWGISALSKEITEFLEAAPGGVQAIQRYVESLPYVSGLLQKLEVWLSEQSFQLVSHAPSLLIGLIIILLSAFFFSRDREVIFALIKKWCPEWLASYAKPIGLRLKKAWIGLLKTEFILVAMVAAVCIVVLWLMGNSYALMMGIAIALLDSLPILGAGIVLWPWAGYLAFTGDLGQAAWLMVLYGIVTVIRNVVGPRILGEQIDMHPLAAIMAIFIGVKAFGAVGVLAGPALLIAVKTVLDNEYGIKTQKNLHSNGVG